MAMVETPLLPPPSPTLSTKSTRSSSSTRSVSRFSALQDIVPPRPLTTVEGAETSISISEESQKCVKLKVDAGPGCGGVAWPSGEVLSRYIAYRNSRDAFLKGKKVIELGSGTGLVGIAAGLTEQTAEIWATDQRQLLDLMQRNVTYNGVAGHVKVEELNWGESLPAWTPPEIDIVLAADCVYFEPAFPLLVKTLCDLAPIGKEPEILFCWKKRRKADKRFFAMLKKHFKMVPVEDDRPGEKERYSRQGISLLRLHRIR